MRIKFFLFTILLSLNVSATPPDPYVEALIEKHTLHLPDGKEVHISYFPLKEDVKIRIIMKDKGKVIWDRSFINEFDEPWYQAHFIPVLKDKFTEDLNEDGFPEIGIAIWNGGKAPCASSGIVFTVKNESLEFLKKQEINTEFSRQIYKTKNDFKNLKYRDPLCNY